VADEVDPLADFLELGDEPIDVGFLRRREAGGARGAEAGASDGDVSLRPSASRTPFQR
jgi:hypothetical protein